MEVLGRSPVKLCGQKLSKWKHGGQTDRMLWTDEY